MNKKAWVVTGAFLAALAFGTGANLLTPEKAFSETENRVLQTFPPFSLEELTSGRFTTTFDTYTTDQFWNRDGWVGLKTMTSSPCSIKTTAAPILAGMGFCLKKPTRIAKRWWRTTSRRWPGLSNGRSRRRRDCAPG